MPTISEKNIEEICYPSVPEVLDVALGYRQAVIECAYESSILWN